MNSSLLLVVDPQVDFISGTLPVPDAASGMDALTTALPRIPVEEVWVTLDAHPIGHCSFAPQGGLWPVHCVKYSVGAAVYEPLMQALMESGKPVSFIEKGTEVSRDAYSAFETSVPSVFASAERIYVAGLAGDVCVHTSLSDLIRHGLRDKLVVIADACPSLDGGGKLSALVAEQGLRMVKTTEL